MQTVADLFSFGKKFGFDLCIIHTYLFCIYMYDVEFDISLHIVIKLIIELFYKKIH